MRPFRVSLIGLSVGTAVLLLFAHAAPRTAAAGKSAPPQTNTPAQGATPAASQTPLRASTHLVQINVIAQDKKGNPIADLTKDDFQVFDQGKPQPISIFSVETTQVQPPSAALPSANANVFSNRIDQQAGVPTSVTIILLDLLNTHVYDLTYARQQIKQFLKTLQPQDRVALYGLTDRITVLHNFTNDASSLLDALNRVPTRETPQASAADFDPSNTGVDGSDGGVDLDSFIDRSNQSLADISALNRALVTTQALETIADYVAPLPGRKNLIWVSGGFPLNINSDQLSLDTTRRPQFFDEEIERAARALGQSGIAIYPVDARGLIGNTLPPAASRGPRFSAAPTINLPNQAIFDTMNMIAERTGGRAYFNTNDVKGAIRRAIDDSRVTYVLGYYPDHGQWNGKFREIKIKVKRPDTNIRYRRGYFALSDEAPLDAKQSALLLASTAASPIDSSTLGMTVTTKPVDVPGAQVLKASAALEAGDFVLVRQGDHWVGALDFLFAQIGEHDKVVYNESNRIDLNVTDKDYERISHDGLQLSWSFRIAPGAQQFRIIARDPASGTTGSVTIPLLKLFPSLAPQQ